MSEPAPQTFRLPVGAKKVLVFTMVVAPDDDVSGWDLGFYLRRRGALLLTKTSGAGVECTDGDAGVWEVTLDEEDSTDEDGIDGRPGLYDWALWRTDDGSENPLAYGTCQVYRTARTG